MEKFLTYISAASLEPGKMVARFGFSLLSVNKATSSNETMIIRTKANDWHNLLMKFLAYGYRNSISVMLRFIANGSDAVQCYLIVSLSAASRDELEKLQQEVQTDMAAFFDPDVDEEHSPYLFEPIADENLLTGLPLSTEPLLFTSVYRKPLKTQNDGRMGFSRGHSASAGPADEHAYSRIFPVTQNIVVNNDLFRAMLAQKGYTEINIELTPAELNEAETSLLSFILKNSINIHIPDHQARHNFLQELFTFLSEKNNKFLVSVQVITEKKNASQFIKSAVKSYCFGAWPAINSETVVFGTSRFSIKNSLADRLPFFFQFFNVIQVFRLPFPEVADIPGISQQDFVFQQMPRNISNNGLLLGEKQVVTGRKKVRLSKDALMRHLYIMGQTGTGKSTLMKTMITDCLQQKEGFTLIDPHGDLSDEILLLIPKKLKDKLVVLDLAHFSQNASFNLIHHDPEFPEQKSLMINELFKIFSQLYDMKHAGGPIFELYFRNGLMAVMDDEVEKMYGPATLSAFNDFFWDDAVHKKILEICSDSRVKKFVRQAKLMTGETSWVNVAPYITSKINRLLYDDYISRFVTSKENSFNFRKHMDDGGILIVKLDKGKVGSENICVFGQLLLNKLFLSAMSRSNIPYQKRKQHFIFIDEFQNFIYGDIASALAELRKYGVSLVLANQTMIQLKGDVAGSILGNVGSYIFFRPGVNDYEQIKHYLEPEFKREDILRLPNFHCISQLMNNNTPGETFVFQTILS